MAAVARVVSPALSATKGDATIAGEALESHVAAQDSEAVGNYEAARRMKTAVEVERTSSMESSTQPTPQGCPLSQMEVRYMSLMQSCWCPAHH